MQAFVPRELDPHETRVPIVPDTAAKLVKKGVPLTVESGLGVSAGHADADYEKAGAKVTSDRNAALAEADLVLRLRKPPIAEIRRMKRGSVHVSYLDPFNERELVEALAEAGVSAVCMELMPRTTRAQKMDALSSQANLAGYVAVILAAERLNKILPMMMTPAGTIAPARVFIIGAGVAGLQAIATAKRLGARVEAFDTRPVVAEQVHSLGARFVKVDLGETGQTKDGYARELTEEQKQKQRDAMARVCAQSDIVITTAQVFGRKAPLIVTDAMLAGMQPGSIVVDLAVETGGNVEGAVPGEEKEIHGVRVIGLENLPGRVAVHASQMYSSNVGAFVEEFWDTESKTLKLNREDEIIGGCLVTHNGEVVHEMVKKALSLA